MIMAALALIVARDSFVSQFLINAYIASGGPPIPIEALRNPEITPNINNMGLLIIFLFVLIHAFKAFHVKIGEGCFLPKKISNLHSHFYKIKLQEVFPKYS